MVSYAQDHTNYLRTDLIAPSPTAGSLGRYGEVPLNLSTGALGLTIPIFDVKGNELSLPISLGYSYDGFKPSQQIGWVGLGWNLNAGGVITHIVHGKVDNTSNSGYNYEDATVQERIHNINVDKTFLKNIVDGLYDSETDIYNFNFAGYSGKFIYFKGKFYCFPYQKFKITGTPESSFTITTPEGIKYTFGARETSHAKGSSGTSYTLPDYVSSYYLTEIRNASGTEAISLEYDSDGQIYNWGTFTQSYRMSPPPTSYPSTLYPAMGTFPTRVDALRLSKIRSEKYVATFVAGADREDVENGYATHSKVLDQIVISNSAGTPLKNFKMYHSYLGSGGFSGKYLKLNSLFEIPVYAEESTDPPVPIDTGKIQKHFFDYFESGNFPSRSFPWLDHFGYYTGYGNFNGALIPDIFYNQGPNRNPNFWGTLLGALTKVTYPTGGKTEFQYEMNEDFNGYNYLMTPKTEFLSLIRPANNPYGTLFGYKGFTLNSEQTIGVTIYRKPKVAAFDNLSKNLQSDVVIYRVDGSNTGEVLNCSVGFESDSVGKSFSINLPAGEYRMDSWCDSKEKSVESFLYYSEKSSVPAAGSAAGGIRLATSTSTPLTGIPLVKKYKYTTSQGFSSGVGQGINYSTTAFKEIHVKTGGITEEVNTTIVNSTLSENHMIGVPHYYNSVVEMNISSGDTLMTRHDFTSFDNYFLGVEPMRVTQYQRTGPNQFVPVSKKEYEYGIRPDTSFRSILTHQTVGFVEEGGWYDASQIEFSNDVNIYEQGYKYLKKMREVTYAGTDSLVNEQRYLYDLDDTKNLILTKSNGSDGSDMVTKFKYPESYVPGITTGLLSAHVLSPVIEKQVWKKTGADSVLVSSVLTEYNNSFYRPVKISSFELPNISSLNNEGLTGSKYNYLTSDSRFEERASYSYDGSFGRLTTQKLKDGPATAYKWGYYAPAFSSLSLGPNQVIAECRNATEAEFFYENFEEDATASVGAAHMGNRYHTGAYTLNWAIPNPRAYKVSYWYFDGTRWKYQEQDYTGPVSLSLGAAVDEVCVYPKDAQISTYAYITGLGLMASTDSKGQATYYNYDSFARLKTIKDHNRDIVKLFNYNTIHLNGDNIYVPGSTPGTQISPVYVKKRVSGTGSVIMNGAMHYYTDYAADFYSDAACTQAYTLPIGLTLNYNETTTITYNNGSPGSTTTNSHIVNAPANVSTVALPAMWNYCEGGLITVESVAPATTAKTASKSVKTAGATTNGTPPGGGGGGDDPGYCTSSALTLVTGSGYVVQSN
ncbi:hypothetical protein DBR40_23555 [Pedobacter sp. KBW01]|nr:hypothetical protein DBR40_23555 [Pedobacter sp. KBW01]